MTSRQWRSFKAEEAIDPDLPIIDTHHHIWTDKPNAVFEPYKTADLLDDKTDCGHNVIATVMVDSHSNHRTEGPEAMRPVGETEFCEQVANDAMAKGGKFAGTCAALLPYADLCLGAAVGEVLDAHAAASPRFRGIRYMLAFAEELPPMYGATEPGISKKPEYRAGLAELARRGLTYETWVFQHQLDEVLDLVRAFPNATFVIDHSGGPLQIGRYAGRREEGFQEWKKSMAAIASCPNTVVKLGALYLMQTAPAKIGWPESPLSSEELANRMRDYVLAAVDLFSPARSMVESNFPVEMLWTSYGNQWNAFKRVLAGYSEAERRDMFAGVAQRVYKI